MHNTILNPLARIPREDTRPDAATAASATPTPATQQSAGHGDLWQTHRLRWCQSLVETGRPSGRTSRD